MHFIVAARSLLVWLYKFNANSLHEKEDLCSHLNMEYVTSADYTHAKWVCEDREYLEECHDL